MKVVITQPTFLPWLGYLAQMASCDVFICLDNVQFNRRSWQHRNRIVSRDGKINYLSVNIKKGSPYSSILETYIAANYNFVDLDAKVANYYHGCPYAREGLELSHELYTSYHQPGISLADANVNHLIHISKLMGLSTIIERASMLENRLKWETPTERLLAICKLVGASTYLSSVGARTYMQKELFKFSDAGIDVQWQQFDHSCYINKGNFVSHLSCVDFFHHQSAQDLLPYILSCNRFISEQNFKSSNLIP